MIVPPIPVPLPPMLNAPAFRAHLAALLQPKPMLLGRYNVALVNGHLVITPKGNG